MSLDKANIYRRCIRFGLFYLSSPYPSLTFSDHHDHNHWLRDTRSIGDFNFCFRVGSDVGVCAVDVRFPTSLTGDGTDAMFVDSTFAVVRSLRSTLLVRNTECDYSSAYVILQTSDSNLVGQGMTFTIGRGNDLVRPLRRELLDN